MKMILNPGRWSGRALFILLMTAAVSQAAETVLPVAVFDFESKDESVRDLGPKVATLMNAYLSAEPQIDDGGARGVGQSAWRT